MKNILENKYVRVNMAIVFYLTIEITL